MKKKIGILCLILFFLLISISGITLSIHTLNEEITDLELYVNAIIMLVSCVLTLLLMVVLALAVLIKKLKSKL